MMTQGRPQGASLGTPLAEKRGLSRPLACGAADGRPGGGTGGVCLHATAAGPGRFVNGVSLCGGGGLQRFSVWRPSKDTRDAPEDRPWPTPAQRIAV